MRYKLLLLTIFAFSLAILFINVAQAECGNSYCEEDLNETVDTCCVDCGCEGDQTCYGVPGASDYQKSCIDKGCGDGFCDETLDDNSIPEEYWKNCCDDCGCEGSDKKETQIMADYNILYYKPTDDSCYDNRCDGCHIDVNCDDGYESTLDECLYLRIVNKSVCFNTPIDWCENDDGYCPTECTIDDDNDCDVVCGDAKCEASENCETCPTDCSCGWGYDCTNGTCQEIENFCDLKGEVKEGVFCSGVTWMKQFEGGHYCDYDYECESGACEGSSCVSKFLSKEAKVYYTKIGIITIILAFVVVYWLIIINRYWHEKT